MFRHQKKMQLPLSDPFHRNLRVQAKAAIHRDHYSKIFPISTAADFQPAHHISRQLTSANKAVIQSLPQYLDLSHQL